RLPSLGKLVLEDQDGVMLRPRRVIGADAVKLEVPRRLGDLGEHLDVLVCRDLGEERGSKPLLNDGGKALGLLILEGRQKLLPATDGGGFRQIATVGVRQLLLGLCDCGMAKRQGEGERDDQENW